MNRAHRRRKTNRSTPLIILLLVVIGVGLFGIHRWDQLQREKDASLYSDEHDAPTRLTLEYAGETYALRGDLDTYLLIGLDEFTNTLSDPEYFLNNQQADFLFLMVVDKTNRSYSAIHLNRDTMAEISRLGMSGKKIGSYTAQLALSHNYGSGGKDSCRNTVQAVSGFLKGVPIEHYASLTMDAIPVLNDLVGGVTVFIEDDFSGVDLKMQQGKSIRLAGKQALTFVRARQDVADGSNLSRMNRQKVFLDALYEQMMQKLQADDGFAARLASNLMDYCVSDLTTDEMANLADRLKDYRYTGIETIPGEAVLGEKFMEFYADEDALLELIVREFFEPANS